MKMVLYWKPLWGLITFTIVHTQTCEIMKKIIVCNSFNLWIMDYGFPIVSLFQHFFKISCQFQLCWFCDQTQVFELNISTRYIAWKICIYNMHYLYVWVTKTLEKCKLQKICCPTSFKWPASLVERIMIHFLLFWHAIIHRGIEQH